MDPQMLVQALGNTLNPDLRQQAENFLEEAHRAANFTPCLLQIVVNRDIPEAAKQAGAIYLKNSIYKYWRVVKTTNEQEEVQYSIPEAEKVFIRDNLVTAVIQSSGMICRQLCLCLELVVKQDFPERWTGVVTQTHAHLASDNQGAWLGSLLSFYQLSKKYKFKAKENRMEYNAAMATFLPLLYQRMVAILTDQSELSVSLQHSILKIFFSTMQHALPQDLMNESNLPGWIEVFKTVVDRPVPQQALEGDEDDRPQLEWWKCKKWALHILGRFFDRYSNPSCVEEEYNMFSQYYLKTFNSGVIGVLLRQLEVRRQGHYLSPRVLQGIFHYLGEGVVHAASWKLMKPHFQVIFEDIVFPMMCYNDTDDELWKEDPYEYIRIKFDVFDDIVSPLVAGQHFMTQACTKRKGTLDHVVAFCVSILTTPTEQMNYRRKDGALHVIGSLYEVLVKKYRGQLEPMLVAHVFPEFTSQLPYMRARACWMLRFFSDVEFSDESHSRFSLEHVLNCLISDQEMPVKVEAAVALQYLIKSQNVAKNFIKPYVKRLIQELLVVMQETENDDLAVVIQELIETYTDEIEDVAVSLCSSLICTFEKLMNLSSGSADCLDDDNYKALTALGILAALQSLVKATFNALPIIQQLETTMLSTLVAILQNGIMDFYEEVLSLLSLLTMVSVSEQMWQLFPIIYDTFTREGCDYFPEMMPVLYNFVKIDTDTFLSDSRYLEMIITMCKTVLSSDPGEEIQTMACKLLEVVVIQCQGRIDAYIPNIIEASLERLTRNSKSHDMRTMCMQVAIASLYGNAVQLLELLEKIHFPQSTETISHQFYSQWVHDAEVFEGIHNRKVSVLGFCALIQCQLRPTPVVALAQQIVPAILTQLLALKDAYQRLAAEEAEDEEEEEAEMDNDEEDMDSKELEDEEDGVDIRGQQYIRSLAKRMSGESDSESDESEMAQTSIEVEYETTVDDEDIDEFIAFKMTLHTLSQQDPNWYGMLTGHLTQEQARQVQEMFILADKRAAAKEARVVELSGGYRFAVTTIPNSFAFGGQT